MCAGHGTLVEQVRRLEAAYPDLHFTGNWLAGVSVANCIDNASALAGRVAAGLAADLSQRHVQP